MHMKKNSGITLIALVLTIIVLLILAGVAISMLTGENGLLNKAVTAKDNTEIAQEKEQVDLAVVLASETNNDATINKKTLITELKKINGITEVPDNDTYTFPLTVIGKTGTKYTIDEDGNVASTTETAKKDEDNSEVMKQAKAAMPEGASILSGTTKETGIVMVDKNGNEWVWIEVPASVFTKATSSTDYDNIKADLIEYAKEYREGASGQGLNFKDEWYDHFNTTYDGTNEYSEVAYINSSDYFTSAKEYYGTLYKDNDDQTKIVELESGETYEEGTTYYAKITDTLLADTSGCGLTYEEYDTNYKKMLSSIYTNKGFYIGRYEAGIDGSDEDINLARTDSSSRITETTISSLPKAVSKQDMIPYNYVYCREAQSLASKMATADSNKTTSLMFGIQWDLVCRFLEVKGTSQADIKSDSTSWGNYRNRSLTLSRGKYLVSEWKAFDVNTTNYVTNKTTSDNESYYQLLTTGASEKTKKMNIYDFAGNEWEWTLERCPRQRRFPCTYRGGSRSSAGTAYPASYRAYQHRNNKKQFGRHLFPPFTLLVGMNSKAVFKTIRESSFKYQLSVVLEM